MYCTIVVLLLGVKGHSKNGKLGVVLIATLETKRCAPGNAQLGGLFGTSPMDGKKQRAPMSTSFFTCLEGNIPYRNTHRTCV